MGRSFGVYRLYTDDNGNVKEGTAIELAQSLKCKSDTIVTASTTYCSVKGYWVKRVGKLIRKYMLYKNGVLIDTDTLDELCVKYGFVKSTCYSASYRRDGRFGKIYNIEATSEYKLEKC